VSCSCGNSFPVTCCTISLLLSWSCLFGQGVCWSLDRKGGDPFPWPPHSPGLTLDSFFREFIENIVYHENEQNLNELCDNCQSCRHHYQWNANTWHETEYHLAMSCATHGATSRSTKYIYFVAPVFKIYRFFQYTLWLTVYSVLFYCHLRLDIQYMTTFWNVYFKIEEN
jgi:hypothetical protein